MKAKNFFNIGLLFSSVDSLPIFSGISMYSPYISVICFLIYYLYSVPSLYQYKFHPKNFLIFIFIILSLFISLFKGVLIYHDIKGFINFTIQILIAVFLYKAFNLYFKSLPQNSYIEEFSKTFITYSLPIIILGIVEIIIFPVKSLLNLLMSMLSWRHTIDRIQLASGEPAWASRFLLTFISILPLSNLKKKRKQYLIAISLLILLFTGSTLGIICVILYYGITYLKKKYIGYILMVIIISIIAGPIMYNHLSDYTKSRIELLSNLGTEDIATLAVNAGSGSVIARLGNPILAFHMGVDNLFIGVGGGYYYVEHYTYLNEIFPSAANLKNINEVGTTPKNLFARIFAETGIIGLIIVFIALGYLYRNKLYNNLLRGIFLSMILLTLNFDSLFHIFPLLLFCFLNNLPPKTIIENDN